MRLYSELTTNLSGVQPVGSPDIVLVGFEPKSVWFRILVAQLARSDSGLERQNRLVFPNVAESE